MDCERIIQLVERSWDHYQKKEYTSAISIGKQVIEDLKNLATTEDNKTNQKSVSFFQVSFQKFDD
jgi:hypothetical protein